VNIERRLNGLEGQIEPRGRCKPCGACGGIHRNSPRLAVVQSMDELGKCRECGRRLDPKGRPFGYRGVGGVVHQKVLVLPGGLLPPR